MNALPDRETELPEPSPSEIAIENWQLFVTEIVPLTTNESLELFAPEA